MTITYPKRTYFNPLEVYEKYKGKEDKRWQTLFCKILIAKGCLRFCISTKRKDFIEVIITNKYDFDFKVSGSDWSFMCIMLGKYMGNYFEIRNVNEFRMKIRTVQDSLMKGRN